MALITCGECGRQVSDKAPVCPGCGVAVAAAAAVAHSNIVASTRRQQVEGVPQKKSRTLRPGFLIALAIAAGAAGAIYRASTSEVAAPPSAGLAAALRKPKKVVSERVSLKEGQSMMYSFELLSDARVQVEVEADPKNVDVMLMTSD